MAGFEGFETLRFLQNQEREFFKSFDLSRLILCMIVKKKRKIGISKNSKIGKYLGKKRKEK